MKRSNKLRLTGFLGAFLFLILPVHLIAQVFPDKDLVIKNGKIIDGTGGDPYYATLVINNGSITEIQRDTTLQYSAKRTIDANGHLVTPGFIDTHSHGDPLETPQFQNFLAMGVTTISLGQDGFSPELEDLPGWINKVNAARPGVNIISFAGHNTLRELSGVGYDSVPAKDKLQLMENMLERAMAGGAFGMTTGLEYSPGEFSRKEELRSLAKIVGRNEGIIMSHMRDEDDDEVEASIMELLEMGAYCPVHISHIKVVYGKGETRAREILDIINKARENGVTVTADIYPYTASYTGIAILFPDWAKQPNNYPEVLSSRRDELADFLRNKVNQRNGPGATLIGTGPFKGQNLAMVAAHLNKPFEDVVIDDIGPYGAGAAHFIMDEVLQRSLLKHPHINICSDGSPSMRHPRGYGSFPKIIETHVLAENLLKMEEAIHKMTGLAAEALQLGDRGIINEGMVADLLIFRPEDIKENATYEDPHVLAGGMQYVIVNGELAKENNTFSENGHGKVLIKNER